ncbi:TetR/AcrR family transcriptional regulator [Pontibacillus halophilus]|nr:TetR/AcrR family transcriptional regulator [Pontibacillus halophilus]
MEQVIQQSLDEGKKQVILMQKREDILSATLTLIIDEGVEAVTLSKILKRADVGSGTLYNYFSSKEELILVLYTELRQKMSSFVLDGYDPNQSLRLRFENFVQNLIRYCIQHHDEVNFIEHYSYTLHKTHKDDSHLHESEMNDGGFFEAFLALIKDGQNEKIFRPLDQKLVFQLLSGMIFSVTKGAQTGKFDLTDEYIQQVVTACWNAIKE